MTLSSYLDMNSASQAVLYSENANLVQNVSFPLICIYLNTSSEILFEECAMFPF